MLLKTMLGHIHPLHAVEKRWSALGQLGLVGLSVLSTRLITFFSIIISTDFCLRYRTYFGKVFLLNLKLPYDIQNG